MPNYQQSKIYKIEPICNHEENEIYIGSTTRKYLSQRMDSHGYDYQNWKDGKSSKVNSYILFDKYGFGNCRIILLELVNVKTKEELLAREAYYIKSLKCVNKYIPLRTDSEYYIDNKEKLDKQNKENYYKNREHVLERHAEKLLCACGKMYTYGHKSRHVKCVTHKEYIHNKKLKEGIVKCTTFADFCKFMNN